MDWATVVFKKSYVLPFVLFLFISLSGCPLFQPTVTDPVTVSWVSCEQSGGELLLNWTSGGEGSGVSYLLQRLTTESEWRPEDGVRYSVADSAVPGLLYCGPEDTYTDSTFEKGNVYNYRLFAADGELSYSAPVTLTVSQNDEELSIIEAPLLLHIRQEDYYIDICWEGCGDNIDGYIISRSEYPISWNPENGTEYSAGQADCGGGIVWEGCGDSFRDLDVISGKKYYYKIFAYNSDKLYSAGLQCQFEYEVESELVFKRFPWIDNYIIYYGPLDAEAIDTAQKHDLVIIHPNNNSITRDQVRQIQRGVDSADPSDDVFVVAYVAVGEDLRTTRFYPAEAEEPNYEAMLDDERFVRNGIGPRVDPRGPTPDGDALEYNYSIGDLSPGGAGFASYYLDDNDAVNGIPDGKPDFNESWRGAFVNAGDPLWFQEVDQMRRERDGICGLKELLTTSVGIGLGVDGIFMDALDTCAPNGWTDENSYVQTEFEWTAPGYADFIRRLKEKYPDKIVVQNRAVFLFRSGFKQKYLEYTTRPYIDFLLFESFRLNSSSAEDYNTQYYFDNRYNYAPSVLAEAGRNDGFQVLSLGYAEGPSGELISDLNSGAGNSSLLEDIRVTQNIGFRHYLSNRFVDHLNTYVLDNGDLTDDTPPAWTSVYNGNASCTPPQAPEPRWGLLKAETPASGVIRVYWDLAQDKYPVEYYLYYKTSEFDFSGNPSMEGISRVKLSPEIPEAYRTNTGLVTGELYPFFDDVEGFTPGETYYLCIRAVDCSFGRNMDSNTSSLYITP